MKRQKNMNALGTGVCIVVGVALTPVMLAMELFVLAATQVERFGYWIMEHAPQLDSRDKIGYPDD